MSASSTWDAPLAARLAMRGPCRPFGPFEPFGPCEPFAPRGAAAAGGRAAAAPAPVKRANARNTR